MTFLGLSFDASRLATAKAFRKTGKLRQWCLECTIVIIDETPDTHPHGGDLPPLAWLRSFEAAVNAGGIRSAGRRLGLDHSVVSRQISQLEAWLGVALRSPESHRFALTPQGSKYFARIATPLAEIAGATRELMAQVAETVLQLWCSPGLSVQWLAGQISEFRRLYPDYAVELRPSERPANLKAYEADANLYLQPNGLARSPPESSVSAYAVGRPVSVIAASPDLLQRLPTVRSARDLLACPLLRMGQDDMWKLWFSMHGVELDGEVPGELCWDSHMALEAARLGRGLLWANPLFLERSLARGDLLEVRIPGVAPLPVGTYVLTCREDRRDMPVMKRLRRFLRERMRTSERFAPPHAE